MIGPLKDSTSCFLIWISHLVLVPIGLFHRTQSPHFIVHRAQSPCFYYSQDSKSSLLSFIGLKSSPFIFHRSQSPCLYHSQDSKSSLYLSEDSKSSLSFTRLKVLTFRNQSPLSLCFHRTQSPLSFTFQRLQCLLSFPFLQDFNVFCLLHFIRLQHLLSFIRLNVLVFVLLRTQHPLFLCFGKNNNNKKELQMSSAL